MPCIERVAPPRRVGRRRLDWLAAGCRRLHRRRRRAGAGDAAEPAPPAAAPRLPPARTAHAPAVARRAASTLPAPRDGAQLGRGAACRRRERLVAANPDITYIGKVPEQLLAIPVLEIELNADGSVRRIEVLRQPRQAKDTCRSRSTRCAAPRRSATCRACRRPWKFVETFLFDDDRKFKPRTLDD